MLLVQFGFTQPSGIRDGKLQCWFVYVVKMTESTSFGVQNMFIFSVSLSEALWWNIRIEVQCPVINLIQVKLFLLVVGSVMF